LLQRLVHLGRFAITPVLVQRRRLTGLDELKAQVAHGSSRPKARVHAERWIGSLRRECLDRLLILGRRHLQHVLATYVSYYNQHRPHRALDQRSPLSQPPPTGDQARAEVIELARVRRSDRLGDLIHEYQLTA
jgi:putative transposase